MSSKEWAQKILSKVSPEKRHGSVFTVAATLQDADYAWRVAENIERRRAKAKAEREAAS